MGGRYISDRQCLRRRAEGSDHARHRRHDRPRRHRRGSARQRRRRAVYLDALPYKLALDAAKGKLDAARSNYDKLKTNLKSLTTLADLAQKNVELKKRDVDRKTALVNSQAGSRADVDTSASAMVTAELQAQFTVQQRDSTLNQLLGNPPTCRWPSFPEYARPRPRSTTPGQSRAHPPSARDVRHRHASRQHPARAASSPPARRC